LHVCFLKTLGPDHSNLTRLIDCSFGIRGQFNQNDGALLEWHRTW
jgi:hypothetical protein